MRDLEKWDLRLREGGSATGLPEDKIRRYKFLLSLEQGWTSDRVNNNAMQDMKDMRNLESLQQTLRNMQKRPSTRSCLHASPKSKGAAKSKATPKSKSKAMGLSRGRTTERAAVGNLPRTEAKAKAKAKGAAVLRKPACRRS